MAPPRECQYSTVMYNNSLGLCDVELNTQTHTHTQFFQVNLDQPTTLVTKQNLWVFYRSDIISISKSTVSKHRRERDLSFGYGSTENQNPMGCSIARAFPRFPDNAFTTFGAFLLTECARHTNCVEQAYYFVHAANKWCKLSHFV